MPKSDYESKCQESFKSFYFFQLEIHNTSVEHFVLNAFFLITSTFETLSFIKYPYFYKLVFTPVL